MRRGGGGVFYTAGVVFFAWKSLRFSTAIWHGFVLAASGCFFAAIAVAVTSRAYEPRQVCRRQFRLSATRQPAAPQDLHRSAPRLRRAGCSQSGRADGATAQVGHSSRGTGRPLRPGQEGHRRHDNSGDRDRQHTLGALWRATGAGCVELGERIGIFGDIGHEREPRAMCRILAQPWPRWSSCRKAAISSLRAARSARPGVSLSGAAASRPTKKDAKLAVM